MMPDNASRLHAAIERFERKHREDPEGRHFLPLATACRRAGDVERAEDLLRAGVDRHPGYLSAHVELGSVLASRGAGDEAGAIFRHVLAADPQNLIALRELAELAVGAGSLHEAENWYLDLLAADPSSDDARHRLAEVRARSSAERDERAGWSQDPEPDAGPEADAGEALPEADVAAYAPRAAEDVVLEVAEPRDETSAPEVERLLHKDDEAPPLDAADQAPALPAGDEAPVIDADEGPYAPLGIEPDEEEEDLPMFWAPDQELGFDPAVPAPDTDGSALDAFLAPDPAEAGFDPTSDEESPLEEPASFDPSVFDGSPAADDAGPDVSTSSDELASETLAELYARQGFRAEAAEMYRALIRRRGEHPALLQRLAELETEEHEPSTPELLAAEPPTEEAAAGDGAPPPDMDAFAASFRTGFAGEPLREAEDVRVEPSIGGYFDRLLAWRPAPSSAPAVAVEPVAPPVPVADAGGEQSAADTAPASTRSEAEDARAAEAELRSFQAWLRGLKQ